MDKEDKELDEALGLWDEVKVDHSRLSSRVWARVANEEREPTTLPTFFRLVQSLLVRPVYAAVFVVSCVLGGLLLAELRVVKMESDRHEQLAESYKQVIDPLLKNTYLGD
ncbi:hypothetical protein [Pelagicoccus mobilis]|uniref:Uncharacterized protein n=1 Tax=Pelagicoccus mobilis TaxID=415221 RepID=A0A934RZL6_9BACT|nr:hypothetical protein [Pelagicoccus mobilis]MBK1880585.1 hypothetical protein [Pelagicoccus mobilis]